MFSMLGFLFGGGFVLCVGVVFVLQWFVDWVYFGGLGEQGVGQLVRYLVEVYELVLFFVFDQVGVFEDVQMVGQGWFVEIEVFVQFVGIQFVVIEVGEDLVVGSGGEGVEDVVYDYQLINLLINGVLFVC